MKNIVLILVVLISSYSFSQKNDVEIKKKGNLTQVTYFYDNGNIEQQGTFNKDGKLQGTWTSYDLQGNKVAVGKYDNSRKVGNWFFWDGDSLKEVNFVDSKIVNVNVWENKNSITLINN